MASFVREKIFRRKEQPKPTTIETYPEEIERLYRKRQALSQEYQSNPTLYLKKREFEERLKPFCVHNVHCRHFDGEPDSCFDRDTLTYNWGLMQRCPNSEVQKMLGEFEESEVMRESEEEEKFKRLQIAAHEDLMRAIDAADRRSERFEAVEYYPGSPETTAKETWFDEVKEAWIEANRDPLATSDEMRSLIQEFLAQTLTVKENPFDRDSQEITGLLNKTRIEATKKEGEIPDICREFCAHFDSETTRCLHPDGDACILTGFNHYKPKPKEEEEE